MLGTLDFLCQTTSRLLQDFRTQVVIRSGERSGSYEVLGAVRKMGTRVCCCLIFIWGKSEGKVKMRETPKRIVMGDVKHLPTQTAGPSVVK